MAGEADSVSSLSASACHIGGRTDVNPGEQTLVYGTIFAVRKITGLVNFIQATLIVLTKNFAHLEEKIW